MRKKFLKDVFLNTLSNFILLGVVQIVIFPYFNLSFDVNYFGEITAIYGFNSIFLVFLGDSLNNVKILHQNKEGTNFNIISIVITIFTMIGSFIIYYIYGNHLFIGDLIFFSLATSLGVFRIYIGSNLRIELDYRNILISNIFVMLGYIFGLLIFYVTNLWSFIFLIGEFFGVIYLIRKTNFINQDKGINANFNIVMKDYFNLGLTYGINGISNYMDRILIIPILGAQSMSVFYSSSVVSKILIMLLGQFNTVFLAHIMKKDSSINKSQILKFQGFLVMLLCIIYYPINKISEISVLVLYPNLLDEAKTILPFITLGIVFFSMSNFTKVFVLKHYNLSMQLYIQIIYTILYAYLAFLFSKKMGVIGFSLVYAIMSIISFCMYLCVIIFFDKKKGKV